MAENIKVNALETASRLKNSDRVLALTDEVNNEVKTISTQNLITSLISTAENNLITTNNGLFVDGSTINELVEVLKQIQAQQADEIGRPIFTLSNVLLSNEIWLEGQQVSRTTYANLFAIYGTTYGAGNGSSTFNLPDCRNRVLWGASNFGYINAGLPNITGSWNNVGAEPAYNYASGAFLGNNIDGNFFWHASKRGQSIGGFYFNASLSNSIYGNSSTVQPPAIKCRVKTRYK